MPIAYMWSNFREK